MLPTHSQAPPLLSMNRVVRVNATDKHIVYFGQWSRYKDNTMIAPLGSEFFFLFRGSIYI